MREARGTLAAALLVVALSLVLYAIHPAFFCKDDFQLQYLPGSRDVMRALGSGTFPLLSPYSWLCAALAGEYQFGVFSVFRMLLEALTWLLPLSLTARGALLFIVHAAVAAAGGYRLARSYGVSSASAMMVAVVAALNGWILWWGTTWYPGIASFAWLPWYWLALRGILGGRSRWSWAGAAFSLYLLITAAWPYSLVMAVAVAVMNFFTALGQRRWRAALVMTGASLLGAALASPSALMLVEYYQATARSYATTKLDEMWVVPIGAIFGLVVPAFTTSWYVFVGWFPHAAMELAGAFVPVVAIAAGWRKPFVRRYVPELLLAFALLLLMLNSSPGPFRWSFRWLPLFHLLLAIMGAAALDERRRRPWLAALVLLAATALATFAFGHDRATTLTHTAFLALLCVVWALFERRGSRAAAAMPAAITVLTITMTFLAFSHRGEVPVWRYEADLLSTHPFDPSRRYLAMYGLDSITGTDEYERITRGLNPELRPGNLPMLSGLHFLNGYSPLGLAAVKNLLHLDGHGPMEPEWADALLQRESGPQQLLHHLGVDGLIVPQELVTKHAALLARNGWTPVARIATETVYHRNQPTPEPFIEALVALKRPGEQEVYAEVFARHTRALPVALLTVGESSVERYGRRLLTEVTWSRHHTSFVVRGKGPKALIVFRRPWMPGWRATINGQPLPVLRSHMIMPAIEIPADAEGEVRLDYRPRAMVIGTSLAGAALALMAAIALWLRYDASHARVRNAQ